MGGKARIVLAALTTPASIMDNTPMLDLVRWVRFRWSLNLKRVSGDTKYGTVTNIVGLENEYISAYMPQPDYSSRTKFYPPNDFQYDSNNDLYICPQGQELRFWTRKNVEQSYVYRADADTCNTCPVKSKCTKSKTGRQIRRSYFQAVLDRIVQRRETEVYKKMMRKRLVWVEPLFGEIKQWRQGERFRLRRLRKVNIEGLIRAAGQNIKRLLKQKIRKHTPDPATSVALTVRLAVLAYLVVYLSTFFESISQSIVKALRSFSTL